MVLRGLGQYNTTTSLNSMPTAMIPVPERLVTSSEAHWNGAMRTRNTTRKRFQVHFSMLGYVGSEKKHGILKQGGPYDVPSPLYVHDQMLADVLLDTGSSPHGLLSGPIVSHLPSPVCDKGDARAYAEQAYLSSVAHHANTGRTRNSWSARDTGDSLRRRIVVACVQHGPVTNKTRGQDCLARDWLEKCTASGAGA